MKETIVAMPQPVQWVTHVRSTVLHSSIGSLRERGHFERYRAQLPAQHADTILNTLSATWLTVDVALAHYGACEAMCLDEVEMIALGESMSQRMHGTFLETLTRAAKLAGVTPWTAYSNFPKLWSRSMQGGSVGVYKVGPKDAVVEIHGNPMAALRYYRLGFQGVLSAAAKFVQARAVTARAISALCTDDRIGYRVAWV